MADELDDYPELINFSTERVLLSVGPDLLLWSVERKHLEKSQHFRTMLQGQWLLSRPRKLELPDVDKVDLRSYLHFLITEEVFLYKLRYLIPLYVYGERLSDIHFKNAVIDAMFESAQSSAAAGPPQNIPENTIRDLYENTKPGSAGRRLLVDIHYHYGDPAALEDGYHKDFIFDLAVKRLEELKYDPGHLSRVVVGLYEENQAAPRTRLQEPWAIPRVSYHEVLEIGGVGETRKKKKKKQKKKASSLAMSCEDGPSHVSSMALAVRRNPPGKLLEISLTRDTRRQSLNKNSASVLEDTIRPWHDGLNAS